MGQFGKDILSMHTIEHNMPSIDEEEIHAVTSVLASGHLIAGKEVARFEKGIRTCVGSQYAVAVSTGHAALHLALVVLGVQDGDEVILPSYTVSDVLNTILYMRAVPVVVDIEENGFGIGAEEVRKKLTTRTKAIIVPHMLGMPAKVDVIQKFGVPILEDSAQALGGNYKNMPIGSSGDVNIFSFYASKILTTGQGGMITTNNKKHYDMLRDLLDYNAPKEYKVRYNYQLTDLAASIGNVQLKKLPIFIARRKEIAEQYAHVLREKNILFYPMTDETNYFRFVIEFPTSEERERIQKELENHNIASIIPLKSYEAIHNILKLDKNKFKNTEKKTITTLSLPLYPALTNEEVGYITKSLKEIL